MMSISITAEKVRALFNAKRNDGDNDIYGVALTVTGGYESYDRCDRCNTLDSETLSFSEEELALEMDEIVPHYENERKEAAKLAEEKKLVALKREKGYLRHRCHVAGVDYDEI